MDSVSQISQVSAVTVNNSLSGGLGNRFSSPFPLMTRHLAELDRRGLDNDWGHASCWTVTAREALIYLGYTPPSDGILFIGANTQFQFKPDEPKLNDKGKPQKYLSPTGKEYDVFIPKHPTDKDYWKPESLKEACWKVNGHPCILLTEGGFKAIAGCSNGIPTIALLGVEMGLTGAKHDPEGKRYLVPSIKKYAEAGLGFIIAFDADAKDNENVRIAEKTLALALKQYNVPVYTVTGHWKSGDSGETKGMDDFIQNKGIEAFRAILMKAESHGEPLDTGDDKPKNQSRSKYLLNKIETHWGERLRLNEMTQQIELNGRAGELNVERVYLRLADELGIDIPKQTASDAVAEIGEKYAYSPVRDYLNSLTGIEPINLDSLAERYFGTSDPLHATLLKRTLIAAVARVFKPGCKVDTLCILQGDQGFLKSTFWETLASETFFTDNLSEANEKDEKLKLRRYWILEFSEFETAYKRKEVEQLKAFLSSRIDSLRRPYGRAIEDFPRTSIFVGSTNGQQFLHDPTGERRYWVVKVNQRIPIETLKAERDRIWATALAAYKAGEQWWLTPEEDKLLAEANQSWQSSDTWEEDILRYLELRSSCTVGQLLEKVIGLDIGQHGKGEQMRVSDILRRNGWVRSKKRIDGKSQWCWEKVGTEVGTAQKPHCITTSDTPFPPVPTFYPKDFPSSNSAAEPDKTKNTQSEKSFENRGGNTAPDNIQNPSQQGIEPVPTSPKQGGNTAPQCPETGINKHHAGKLADQMREAIANGSSAQAKEIWAKFENIPLSQRRQQRGFFWQSLEQTGEKRKASLLIFAGLLEGEKINYVGSAEQYKGLELTAYDADSRNCVTVACLMSDGCLTTWIPLGDLRKL